MAPVVDQATTIGRPSVRSATTTRRPSAREAGSSDLAPNASANYYNGEGSVTGTIAMVVTVMVIIVLVAGVSIVLKLCFNKVSRRRKRQ